MALKVKVGNLNKKRKINRPLMRKTAISVLAGLGKKKALIDITFVSDGKIKALNKKYMKRAGATDVISFELKTDSPKDAGIVGDVYISSDRAFANAKRFKSGFQKELLLCAIHGVLHLLGFGDKTVKERNRIRKLEEAFLNKL